MRELSPLLGEGIAVRPMRIDGSQAALQQPAVLDLTDERRARLVDFVKRDSDMPEDARARVLAQLAEKQVPQQVVDRIERRMGG